MIMQVLHCPHCQGTDIIRHGKTRQGFVANIHWRRFVVWSLPVTRSLKRRRAMMAVSFKGAHFPKDIILMGVRWYVAYPLSYRHIEELMEERGVEVDHSTIQRWVVKYSPPLEEAFHRRKRPVWVSWRMDETYIKVKGEWRSLYRAVDKQGQTIDFLLTEQRDEHAAKRFLTKAIRRHGGVPGKITIDGSAANDAAIIIRKTKYLKNIVAIVFTQLTKTRHLAARMSGDGVADFHVPIGHQD